MTSHLTGGEDFSFCSNCLWRKERGKYFSSSQKILEVFQPRWDDMSACCKCFWNFISEIF